MTPVQAGEQLSKHYAKILNALKTEIETNSYTIDVEKDEDDKSYFEKNMDAIWKDKAYVIPYIKGMLNGINEFRQKVIAPKLASGPGAGATIT